MGTFTNRSTKWEVMNSWWLILQVISFGLLSFLGLLYVGLLGNRHRWIWAGLISLAAFPLALLFNTPILSLPLVIGGCGGSIVYSFYINKEFLQRLDAIGRGLKVPANQKYIGMPVIPVQPREIINTVKDIDALPSSASVVGLQFIANLKKWELAVEPVSLKNNIKELIHISEQIAKKQSVESDRFFVRYADSVNQLLAKYDQIENARLNNDESKRSLQEVENFIEKIVQVFKKEFTELYKSDLLDIDSEVAAFTQSLKNRGLLEDDFQQPSKNTQP